jgi:hypothetical protein
MPGAAMRKPKLHALVCPLLTGSGVALSCAAFLHLPFEPL